MAIARNSTKGRVSSQARIWDRERMVLGAIGGALVAVIAYPLPAYETLFTAGDGVFFTIGWLLRLIGLSFLGGLWAYLHKSERDRVKTFQLGIVGPAIISAMVSANVQGVERRLHESINLRLISPAYAQAASGGTQSSSRRAMIVEGLLGTQRP